MWEWALFWLLGGYLKEQSEGHRRATALCLLQKMLWRASEGDGGGEASWTALAAFFDQLQTFM